MSRGYMVRFVGGPAHDEIHEVPELLDVLRIPVHKCHPLLVPSLGTPHAPGVAVYTLTRTPYGAVFYQYRYEQGALICAPPQHEEGTAGHA